VGRLLRLLSVVVLTGWSDGDAVPTATSALEVVDGEVRELIRRRGLDPFTDPGPVRLLVRDVVADYSERSLTSALPPIGDADAVVRDVLDRVAGFGPLQRWLDDPEVEEIWVNEPGRVFVARRGRSELTTTILAPGELADLVERMLRTSGRRHALAGQTFADPIEMTQATELATARLNNRANHGSGDGHRHHLADVAFPACFEVRSTGIGHAPTTRQQHRAGAVAEKSAAGGNGGRTAVTHE